MDHGGADPSEHTASAVRAELARRNISRRTFAKDMGWPISSTARRLNGDYPFTVPQLVAAADYLGVPLLDLLPPQGEAAA